MLFFGAGKSILLSKKIIPSIITKAIANFNINPRILTLELVFFYKLHIFLVNFKLRHICVFSIKKLMKSKGNIVFLGMMGSGKTSVGKLISKKLKLDFFDIDQQIEKKLNMEILKIFKEKGELFFRKIEEKITLDILKKKNIIISLGGGGFLNKNIRKEILINHTSIWLNWDNQTIIDRIKNSKKRPLAFNLSKDDLDQLIKKRSFTYSKSLHKINCNHLSKNEVVNKVLKIYEN